MLDKTIGDVLRDTVPPVALVAETATIADALEKMTNHGVGYCLVSRNAKAVGVVTERDILTRAILRDFRIDEVPVMAVASRPVVTVRPDTPVLIALDLMSENHFRCLPVQEGEVLRGAVSMMGLMSWLSDEMAAEVDDLNDYVVGPSVALRLPGHPRRRRFSSSPARPLAHGK